MWVGKRVGRPKKTKNPLTSQNPTYLRMALQGPKDIKNVLIYQNLTYLGTCGLSKKCKGPKKTVTVTHQSQRRWIGNYAYWAPWYLIRMVNTLTPSHSGRLIFPTSPWHPLRVSLSTLTHCHADVNSKLDLLICCCENFVMVIITLGDSRKNRPSTVN